MANTDEILELIDFFKKRFINIEEELIQRYKKDNSKTLLIIGNPRSGTTLLNQFLANSGLFSYPSNLITRFASTPLTGALIQKLLFGDNINISNESDLGKTFHLLDVNEFTHFWRNYFNFYYPRELSDEEILNVNFERIFNTFAALETIFRKPFVTKGIVLQYNLKQIKNLQNKFFFIYIKRDPRYIMQSIYLARIKFNNDINKWWSVKPKQYDKLKYMDIYHQIAGQFFFTQQAIENGLKAIDKKNYMVINYEQFCEQPKKLLQDLIKIFNLKESSNIKSSDKFLVRNNLKVDIETFNSLNKAYQDFLADKINLY